jgi:hypothetical protein
MVVGYRLEPMTSKGGAVVNPPGLLFNTERVVGDAAHGNKRRSGESAAEGRGGGARRISAGPASA